MIRSLGPSSPRIIFISQIRCFKKTHYETLGVSQDATLDQIKSAFYEKSKKLHPDNLQQNNANPEQFLELKVAYDVLRRPADRRLYDNQLNGTPNPRNYSNPYSNYGGPPHYDFGPDWSTHWKRNVENRTTREERDRSTKEFMKSIAKWMAFGIILVFAYNGGYLYLLKIRQKQIDSLIDEDEIAKCFLRQQEFRDSNLETADIAELGRVLKTDVDEAWKIKCNEQRNTNEIREEYRWFRALQDPEHIRFLKQKRMERKEEERNKWRNERVTNDEEGN